MTEYKICYTTQIGSIDPYRRRTLREHEPHWLVKHDSIHPGRKWAQETQPRQSRKTYFFLLTRLVADRALKQSYEKVTEDGLLWGFSDKQAKAQLRA